MIETVTMTDATWAPAPRKFEAGVPNMAQAAGLAAALKYLTAIGMDTVHAHENELTSYLLDCLATVPNLSIIGPTSTQSRGSSVSFTFGDIHPHDLGQYLDSQGIAVRTGHHCAWPLNRAMGVSATTRASLYLYNTKDDIDDLVTGIAGAEKYFGR
jgi:cysteine desulfurase/selenocysteine lyase